jgi:hypothetical protein
MSQFDELHLLDLRQVEAITQMAQKVQYDLQGLFTISQNIAVVEQQLEHKRVGMLSAREVEEEKINEQIQGLRGEWEKNLLALKASVFNTSNTLRQLHMQRQDLLKPKISEGE